jgi:hypothetical protein
MHVSERWGEKSGGETVFRLGLMPFKRRVTAKNGTGRVWGEAGTLSKASKRMPRGKSHAIFAGELMVRQV